MNKNTIYTVLLSCAAGLLLSCNRESSLEPIPEAGLKPVGFSVENLNSRTVVSDEDEIVSLGIFGYSTGTSNFNPDDSNMKPNLFANRRATREETGSGLSPWEYDPIAYWPLDPNVKNTFFAYSPHIDDFPEDVKITASDGNTSGYPYICYEVEEETNVSDLVDLLYSELNADVRDIDYETNDGKVKYKMKHAMAWVRFLIYPTLEYDKEGEPESNAAYAITEFYFTGGNIVTSAKLNLCTGEWNPIASGSVIYNFDHLQEEEDSFQEIPVGAAQFLGTTANCLMMIPQDIVLSENETAVFVSYWYDRDGQPDPVTGEWDWTEYYITMPFPDVKLKAGSVMTYVVKLSVSGAWIEFFSENTIEEWQEDDTLREIPVF